MRNKPAINPVTIRPEAPGQPALVFLRSGFGFGDGPIEYSVSVAMVDEKTKTPLCFTILPEKLFVGALGHLFPNGELKEAHLDDTLNPASVPAPAVSNPIGEIALSPFEVCVLGKGMLSFATGRMVTHLYPQFFGGTPEENAAWAPTEEQVEKIDAIRGTTVDGETYSCMVDRDQAGHRYVSAGFSSLRAMNILLPLVQALIAQACK